MAQVHTTVFNTLSAVDQWMKTIAGNITGASVTGYRGTQVEFGEVLTQQFRGSAQATDGFGSVAPLQRSDSGIRVTGTRTDFSQGSVVNTGGQTDLAISGDAFFVLSKVPNPSSVDDLVFTRDGSFQFDFLNGPVAGTGTYRLVNKDGLFVMGYQTPFTDPALRGVQPQERNGSDLAAFNSVASNGAGGTTPAQLTAISLDLVRNPDAANNNVTFDARGRLSVAGGDPVDLANNTANVHVGLAKFANPQGLNRQSGGAYFGYSNVAGQIFSGTAADAGPGRVVGSTNVLSPKSVEQANTSINTVMPELTLAQKSFSATSKIISVGNTMIDDVNQLIR